MPAMYLCFSDEPNLQKSFIYSGRSVCNVRQENVSPDCISYREAVNMMDTAKTDDDGEATYFSNLPVKEHRDVLR